MSTYSRVAWIAADWRARKLTPVDNGHPLYVYHQAQGAGRFDLPADYAALYIARQPEAAVGEVFGDFSTWTNAEITRQVIDGPHLLQRCLITLETNREFYDLDDGAVLDKLGWKPSDVVGKDRTKTQQIAQTCWLTRDTHGKGGFAWWSSRNPAWSVVMAWGQPNDPTAFEDFNVTHIEPLTLTTPSVIVAGNQMKRTLGPH